MARFEVIMPKLGESIIEATITRWMKQPGDTIEEDDPIVEIATDKVDSEIPSPVEGKLIELKYKEGDVVEVGKVIAIIDTEPDGSGAAPAEKADGGSKQVSAEADGGAKAGAMEGQPAVKADSRTEQPVAEAPKPEEVSRRADITTTEPETPKSDIEEDEGESTDSDRFYSPLVKNIAKTEGITQRELEKIKGTGKEGRLTKNDLLGYLEERQNRPDKSATEEPRAKPQTEQTKETATAKESGAPSGAPAKEPAVQEQKAQVPSTAKPAPQVTAHQGDEIVDMDRMRRLIADHMVMSKQVSPHVTSFIEVDVTNMVKWREKVKDEFLKREKEKLTFTPIFVEAAIQALKEFPGVNASVDGYKIILRKSINIGVAAALPNGNLIVPVIKNADQKSLLGLAKDVNSLADKARKSKLEPDDVMGGTFTITNFGTFGSITGSPIINQPQVAILGLGVIKKKPVVMETEMGDVIAIRHMVILSLAYDHRVVDGALGGMYLQKLQQILEKFDVNRTI